MSTPMGEVRCGCCGRLHGYSDNWCLPCSMACAWTGRHVPATWKPKPAASGGES